ncbi:MAG: hypothetical protein Q9165_003006 [Trypethelium subeluteriae]
MAEKSAIKEFPDISEKLKAAPKKSIFERQKAEAEAKRLREEEETAAVLKDFVESFDDDKDTLPSSRLGGRFEDATASGPGVLRGGALAGSAPRRHFAPTPSNSLKSGPGSLGPDPSFPPFPRKRGPDGYPKEQGREQGLFSYEQSSSRAKDVAAAFEDPDDLGEPTENTRAMEKAAPKPTVHLSSLPPGTPQAEIRALLPSNLKVDGVKILPPSAPGSQERKSMSALMTLSPDTAAMDIDAAISQLQNRYLGKGYYLSISRHLSSATFGGNFTANSVLAPATKLPFNAKPLQSTPFGSLNRAPPPSSNHAFAPPSSFAPPGPGQPNREPQLVVHVTIPTDIRLIRHIHSIIEKMVEWGPEFEALLMSCEEVQKDEIWAWIWDSRSEAGVYYRWKLWELWTGYDLKKNPNELVRIYDEGPLWRPPPVSLPFEWVSSFEELVEDSDYDSSEEEESDDENIANRHRDHLGGESGLSTAEGEQKPFQFLNPLRKAKLTWLLARLPTSTARLRRGHLASVTHFAIKYAGVGMDEIIDHLVTNVELPFANTSANPNRERDSSNEDSDSDGEATGSKIKEKEDPSSAKLVALYVITDLLNSCANAGIRGAWRYRSAFAPVLEKRRTFERLGRLEKDMQWGRIRTDKWKRAIGVLFTNWETNSVFDSDKIQYFRNVFEKPPLTAEEKRAIEKKESEEQEKSKAKSKWKSVEEKAPKNNAAPTSSPNRQLTHPHQPADMQMNDGQMDLDVANDDAANDDDRDGVPMTDAELTTFEIVEDDLLEHLTEEEYAELQVILKSLEVMDSAKQADGSQVEPQTLGPSNDALGEGETAAVRAKRNRPKAMDMFADSDEE